MCVAWAPQGNQVHGCLSGMSSREPGSPLIHTQLATHHHSAHTGTRVSR